MKYTFFWKNRSPLTNWYPSKFTVDGIEFTRGEQFMMYSKAIMFGDTETATMIMNTNNPQEQKDLGRQVSNYNDKRWSEHRERIMVVGLYAKFSQTEKLKNTLLATGDTIIAEASPYDLVWGVGLAEDNPLIHDEKNWRGMNLLGKVLMQVRSKLK